VSEIQANGGITLYYERAGTGQPLLFINGLGANITETPYLTESYSRHFDYITYDRRGCGRSDKPDGAYSIAQDADDAAGLLEALGIDCAAVYGSSLGGMVAQELALRHPRRVSALILGCTTGGAIRGVQPAPETIQRLAANQQLPGEEGWAAGWRLGYSDQYIAENYDGLIARSRVSSQYGAPSDSYMRQIVAAAQHDTWDRLGEIACPVMIIHGSEDVMIPVGNAHMLAERISHAEVHILEGMGHGYNLEAQAIADGLVVDFIARSLTTSKDAAGVIR
jgi:pimeloyl-ACP methyl ester carboxylesterase